MGEKQRAVVIFILSNLLMSLACKCPPCPSPKEKPPGKPSCPPAKPPRPTPPPVRPSLPPRTPPSPPAAPPYPPPPPPPTPRQPPRRTPPSPPSAPPYSPPPPPAPRKPPPRTPPSTPAPPPSGRCPIDALKLGACVDLLSSLVHVVIGSELKRECCPVIQGLVGLDAAVCFCSVIRVKLLNLSLIVPIALQLILGCGQSVPAGFLCPPQP